MPGYCCRACTLESTGFNFQGCGFACVIFLALLATAVLRNKCQPLGTISFTLLPRDVENPSVGTGAVVVVVVVVVLTGQPEAQKDLYKME